jgi:hypothetical protein
MDRHRASVVRESVALPVIDIDIDRLAFRTGNPACELVRIEHAAGQGQRREVRYSSDSSRAPSSPDRATRKRSDELGLRLADKLNDRYLY